MTDSNPSPPEASPPTAPSEGKRFVLRFHRNDRLLHGMLMASFLTLSLTGMPLLFPTAPWAAKLAGLFGGYRVTGVLHRMAAATLMFVFLTHLVRLAHRLFVKKDYGMLWGPRSLVPQPVDLLQLLQHFRWFVGLGPRPHFDRYSYWEKFDYWAVFWGMAIIGSSGLLLWFPAFFARFLPGWIFNIALVVHGEEALMAMVFIFTVHFFNGHLRPDKFPMDLVIFTGRVSLEELKHERPAEYERMVAENAVDKVLTVPPSPELVAFGRLVGTLAVFIGLSVAIMAIYALLH
jgi:cytochrome b subunit of formate dehydrogenase